MCTQVNDLGLKLKCGVDGKATLSLFKDAACTQPYDKAYVNPKTNVFSNGVCYEVNRTQSHYMRIDWPV